MKSEDMSLTNNGKRGADDDGEQHASKKAKGSGGEASDRRQCVICLADEDTNDNPLLPRHNCSTCNVEAYQICEYCDSTVQSRLCPVCRQPYKAMVLYLAPPVLDAPGLKGPDGRLLPDAMRRREVQATAALVAHIVTASNVVIVLDNRAHFFLPETFEDALPGQSSADFKSLYCSVPVDEARTRAALDQVNGEFHFVNAVWDAIEEECEAGEVRVGLPGHAT